jgi:hypothetical protein
VVRTGDSAERVVRKVLVELAPGAALPPGLRVDAVSTAKEAKIR